MEKTNKQKFLRLSHIIGYLYGGQIQKDELSKVNPYYEEAKQILIDLSPMFAEPKPSASFEESELLTKVLSKIANEEYGQVNWATKKHNDDNPCDKQKSALLEKYLALAINKAYLAGKASKPQIASFCKEHDKIDLFCRDCVSQSSVQTAKDIFDRLDGITQRGMALDLDDAISNHSRDYNLTSYEINQLKQKYLKE